MFYEGTLEKQDLKVNKNYKTLNWRGDPFDNDNVNFMPKGQLLGFLKQSCFLYV